MSNEATSRRLVGRQGGALLWICSHRRLAADAILCFDTPTKRMAAYTHLNHAPIVEALIDFRVRRATSLDMKQLSTISESLKQRYPTTKDIRQLHAQIHIEGANDPVQSSTQALIGKRLESADSRFILQAQLGGFTLSRLNPYDTWESLVDEARFCWQEYVKVATPTAVTRLAARYINRIEIPLSMITDFEDFFTSGPRVPENLPQGVAEFLSRVVVHEPKTGAAIILTQALELQNPTNVTLPIILDIDVFKEAEFDVQSKDYWELLNEFRRLKNDAFFGCLTPKALELFK